MAPLARLTVAEANHPHEKNHVHKTSDVEYIHDFYERNLLERLTIY
jgi:hypothetical protein